MAILYIKNLEIKAKHGVYEHEKQNEQRFLVNVELTVDVTKSSSSDDLNDTVDWELITNTIINIVQNNTFNLMERLAREIAVKILQDKRIEKIIVNIEKIDAFESGTPGITIEMTN